MKFASRASKRLDRHGNMVTINPFDGSVPGTGDNLVAESGRAARPSGAAS